MVTHASQFFDSSLPAEERKGFDQMYSRLSDGVSASLKFFLRYVADAMETTKEKSNDGRHMVPFLMMYDYAEAVDGISILLKKGSVKNSLTMMRQALETSWLLKYLTEAQSTYLLRCMAYEYWHLKDDLATAKKSDPERVAQIEAIMASNRYDDVKAEMLLKPKVKKWYALWDGPGNVEQMAARVGKLGDYELYRQWSGRVHGADAISRMTVKSDGRQMSPERLRLPSGIHYVAKGTMMITVAFGLHLVKFYMPERVKDAESYVIRNVHSLYPAVDGYASV